MERARAVGFTVMPDGASTVNFDAFEAEVERREATEPIRVTCKLPNAFPAGYRYLKLKVWAFEAIGPSVTRELASCAISTPRLRVSCSGKTGEDLLTMRWEELGVEADNAVVYASGVERPPEWIHDLDRCFLMVGRPRG